MRFRVKPLPVVDAKDKVWSSHHQLEDPPIADPVSQPGEYHQPQGIATVRQDGEEGPTRWTTPLRPYKNKPTVHLLEELP